MKRYSPVAPINGVELPRDGKPLHEPRLWGTWKSDRRKTFEHVVMPKATPAGLRKFRSLFGKMVVTWTKTTVSTYFDCDRFMGCPNNRTPVVTPYRVLARSATMVVVCMEPEPAKDELEQLMQNLRPLATIEFDERGYRTPTGLFLEYFRRVE